MMRVRHSISREPQPVRVAQAAGGRADARRRAASLVVDVPPGVRLPPRSWRSSRLGPSRPRELLGCTRSERWIRHLLRAVAAGRVGPRDAFERLRAFPYEHLGVARLDTHRAARRGFPEVVLCEGKRPEDVERIVAAMLRRSDTLLLTRVTASLRQRLAERFPQLHADDAARVMWWHPRSVARRHRRGTIPVVTAGTADVPVAEEAAVTLQVMGYRPERIYDVGVAGVHRLLEVLPRLRRARVLVVAAGMDGALPSVVSGLVAKPVIAVPTSIGYGASLRGLSALLAMLNSCSPGVAVVNIDNGFGAGYLAAIIAG